MTLSEFNNLSYQETKKILLSCCNSTKWADIMTQFRPFTTYKDLVRESTNIWFEHCSKNDYLEAFKAHPKIGDIASLEKKYAYTKKSASNEQKKVINASRNIIQKLADNNETYFKKNGFIFIISASGKTAIEIDKILQKRLESSPENEIKIAMAEQHKITLIRLGKIMPQLLKALNYKSQLTTHVLDTSIGNTAEGILVELKSITNKNQIQLALGITNLDGRISNLLPGGKKLKPGNYSLTFFTKDYFKSHKQVGFYPEITIQFTIQNETHYHIPLLLNPFGFSTYKGS